MWLSFVCNACVRGQIFTMYILWIQYSTNYVVCGKLAADAVYCVRHAVVTVNYSHGMARNQCVINVCTILHVYGGGCRFVVV